VVVFSASFGLIVLLILFLPGNPAAKVTGPCSGCHTMHNSQNGSSMQSEAQATLLRTNGCLGCHASTNPAQPKNSLGAPIVYSTSSAPQFGDKYQSDAQQGLAGGNFYWVGTGNDDRGHNVFSGNPDGNLTGGAPGDPQGTCAGNNACHDNLDTAYGGGGNLKGRKGCTGCHMVDDSLGPKGYHHADDSATVINSFPWYRFLKGHNTGGNHGVTGIEDPNWQQTPTSTAHNEYLGNETGLDLAGKMGGGFAFAALGNTMTGFCCGCHGNFHVQYDSGKWIRHPSDAVIPSSGEYQYYTTYDPLVPVARSSLSSVSSTVSGAAGDMVMCLSCHRPHGSPYPDMLRWDYTTMNAGGDENDSGCFVCHTNKDTGG